MTDTSTKAPPGSNNEAKDDSLDGESTEPLSTEPPPPDSAESPHTVPVNFLQGIDLTDPSHFPEDPNEEEAYAGHSPDEIQWAIAEAARLASGREWNAEEWAAWEAGGGENTENPNSASETLLDSLEGATESFDLTHDGTVTVMNQNPIVVGAGSSPSPGDSNYSKVGDEVSNSARGIDEDLGVLSDSATGDLSNYNESNSKTVRVSSGKKESKAEKWDRQSLAYILENQTTKLSMEAVMEKIVNPLQNIANEIGLVGEMKPFGSFTSGFAGQKSDLDITFLQKEPTAYLSEVLSRFAQRLEKGDEYESIAKVLHAQSPLIRCTHKEMGVEVEILMNNLLGVANSRLLRCYSDIDVRVAQLVRIVKTWAKNHEVLGSQDGCINSYAYVLLVLYYLVSINFLPNLQLLAQSMGIPAAFVSVRKWGTPDIVDTRFWSRPIDFRPDKIENLTIYSLTKGFFDFYLKFPWQVYAVCLRQQFPGSPPTTVPKAGLFYFEDAHRDPPEWYVEDPFDSKHNLAGRTTVEGRRRITGAMKRVLRYFNNFEKAFLINKKLRYWLKASVSATVTPNQVIDIFSDCDLVQFYFPKYNTFFIQQEGDEAARAPMYGAPRYKNLMVEFSCQNEMRKAEQHNEKFLCESQLRLHKTTTGFVYGEVYPGVDVNLEDGTVMQTRASEGQDEDDNSTPTPMKSSEVSPSKTESQNNNTNGATVPGESNSRAVSSTESSAGDAGSTATNPMSANGPNSTKGGATSSDAMPSSDLYHHFHMSWPKDKMDLALADAALDRERTIAKKTQESVESPPKGKGSAAGKGKDSYAGYLYMPPTDPTNPGVNSWPIGTDPSNPGASSSKDSDPDRTAAGASGTDPKAPVFYPAAKGKGFQPPWGWSENMPYGVASRSAATGALHAAHGIPPAPPLESDSDKASPLRPGDKAATTSSSGSGEKKSYSNRMNTPPGAEFDWVNGIDPQSWFGAQGPVGTTAAFKGNANAAAVAGAAQAAKDVAALRASQQHARGPPPFVPGQAPGPGGPYPPSVQSMLAFRNAPFGPNAAPGYGPGVAYHQHIQQMIAMQRNASKAAGDAAAAAAAAYPYKGLANGKGAYASSPSDLSSLGKGALPSGKADVETLAEQLSAARAAAASPSKSAENGKNLKQQMENSKGGKFPPHVAAALQQQFKGNVLNKDPALLGKTGADLQYARAVREELQKRIAAGGGMVLPGDPRGAALMAADPRAHMLALAQAKGSLACKFPANGQPSVGHSPLPARYIGGSPTEADDWARYYAAKSKGGGQKGGLKK